MILRATKPSWETDHVSVADKNDQDLIPTPEEVEEARRLVEEIRRPSPKPTEDYAVKTTKKG